MGRPSRKRVKKASSDVNPEQPDESATYSVINICFEHAKLKLDALARLATTSKQARQMVQLFLQQNTGMLLPGICNKASELNRKITEKPADWSKLVLLVKWFCSMVGKEALQDDAVTLQVLQVRKTPPTVAEMLLEAGMLVTHQHLITAAHKRAEGLEVWVVKPYCKDMPLLTQALCGSDMAQLRKQLPSMQPSDIPNTLVLAVDLLSPVAAEAVLGYLQTDQQQQLAETQAQLTSVQQQQQRRQTRGSARKQLKQHDLEAEVDRLTSRIQQTQEQLESAALIEQLLTLAVARRHSSVVQKLCQLKAAAEVPGAAVADLLHRAVGHKGPQVAVLDELMQLLVKVEAQLPADRILALLQLAVQRRNSVAVHRLVHQEAAQSLDTAAVLELLSTSVQLKDGGSADHLCSLPAAQQIDSDDMQGLLAAAVRLRSGSLARTVCSLPATANVPSAVYNNLMATAVEQGATLVLFELARCPAGQGLSAASAAELLATALGAGPTNDSVISALCDYLPSASAIDRESMCGLLSTAIRDSHSMIVQRLCMLHPAVGQLTPADVATLLTTALSQRIPSSVPLVCQLPAAQFMPLDSLYKAMKEGLVFQKAGGVLQIINGLPGLVHQLEGEQIAGLLEAAMQAGISAMHVVRALSQLQAAQHIASDEIMSLFRTLLRSQGAADAAILLVHIANELTAQNLHQLIREAFLLDRVSVATQLLKLPKAQEMDAGMIAELMLLLLEQTKTTTALICAHRCITCPESEAIRSLCGLPAADQMQPAALVNIIHAIMKAPSRLSCPPSAPQLWLDRIGQLKTAVMGLAAAAQPAGTAASPAAVGVAVSPAAASPTGSSSSQIGPVNSSGGTTYMGSLLGAAICRFAWSLNTLCTWEPAQSLSSTGMESLLAQAIPPSLYAAASQTPSWPPIQLVCRLGGCKDLSPEAVTRLLQSAIRQNREEAVKYVSRIEPAAKQIETQTVIELLHAAIQLPFGKAVHYICHLEGAKGMTAGDVAEVLRMNEEMGFAFDVNTLRSCLFKAAQQPIGGAHTIA